MKPANRHVSGIEIDRTPGRHACFDQVLHDLVLSVNSDDLSAGQVGHVDPMAASLEAEIETLMAQATLQHPVAHTHCDQHIDCALLEDTCPHPVDDVLTAAVLDDHGIDAIEMQQVREQKTGGAGADDSDLRVQARHACFSGSDAGHTSDAEAAKITAFQP